tara:strand:+ start:3454 stop:3867 length:414 start_codon:yes stop_codon:yes gene_type:complete
MAFGIGRISVLESKVDIYEELSKEMLGKLEKAVATISENSNKVAVILERHENRLNESDKNDALILSMLEDVKISNTKEHKAVIERIEKVESKVSDLYKFRWVAVGIAIAAVAALQAPGIFRGILTPPPETVIIQEGK